jgi:glycosyltransferase involved in cell wall biosynthesis
MILPKVSIIVPTYNRAHMVTETIDSILAQTFKDFELIVVDNESADNTEEVIKSYPDQRIRYFKHQNNGVVAVNRNYGIGKAQGQYIAFCDDDDLWLPEKLERQVELLDSNDELGLVYADSYVIDSNGDLRENTYFYGRKPVRGNDFSELFQDNSIPLLTAIVRREVLDKVGVFNPRYIVSQDYDLWLRIAKYHPVDFIEQPLAKYRVHSEGFYQKNSVLAYRENLQIMDYWLNRDPDLKRELGGKIRRRKALLCRAGLLAAISHVCRDKNMKSIREFGNFIKYLLRSGQSIY